MEGRGAGRALFLCRDHDYIRGCEAPMNVQFPIAMDSSAFLAWAEGREGRYELADGRVIMMTGGSRGHALVVRGLSKALESCLAGTPWIVVTSDFGVRTGSKTVRYPDVVVEPKGGQLRDLAAAAPALISEVLSPSSVTDDLGDKATEYLRLSGLYAYLVLSQDEPKAWVWVRGEAGFPAGPNVVSGKDGIIAVPALSIEVPLSEVYEGFPAPES
jgi:Uma2 family endonuclease